MMDAYPIHKDNFILWDRFVDVEGKTTLNPKEYKEFRLMKKQEGIERKKL